MRWKNNYLYVYSNAFKFYTYLHHSKNLFSWKMFLWKKYKRNEASHRVYSSKLQFFLTTYLTNYYIKSMYTATIIVCIPGILVPSLNTGIHFFLRFQFLLVYTGIQNRYWIPFLSSRLYQIISWAINIFTVKFWTQQGMYWLSNTFFFFCRFFE